MSKKYGVIVCDSQAKWGGANGISERMRDLIVDDGQQWTTFIAEKGEFPTEDELKDFQGIYITGSKHSVNDENQPWIQKLESFIQQANNLKAPNVFGTCFGHQVIAKALGGKVGKNPNKRFICNNEEITISSMANDSKFLNDIRAISEAKPFRMIESHGECVIELPKGSRSVAYSGSCEHEVVLYNENIIGCQSHPDFVNEDMSKIILPSLLERNIITDEEYEMAKKSLTLPNVATDVIKAM